MLFLAVKAGLCLFHGGVQFHFPVLLRLPLGFQLALALLHLLLHGSLTGLIGSHGLHPIHAFHPFRLMTVQRFLQFGGLFADGGLRCPADFQRFRSLLAQLFRLAHAAVALIQRCLNELQTVCRLSPFVFQALGGFPADLHSVLNGRHIFPHGVKLVVCRKQRRMSLIQRLLAALLLLLAGSALL